MAKEVKQVSEESGGLFHKDNYVLVIVGVVIIIIGFLLMMGGESPDPNHFSMDDVYSARRITWAPLTILIGLGIEAYAIMRKPKNKA